MTDHLKSSKASTIDIERSWENISISNDFLFGKLMRQYPGLCKKLLQRILPSLAIDHIEILETQKSIDQDVDARSVRLDVYLSDDKERVYSIEMQMTDTKELPRRSRYYQAMIDLQLLDKGITYRHLNDTYIIFICPFDLYGKGRHMYTFDGVCKEDSEVNIADGATRIFLNARGTMDDVSSSLRAFLDYVAGKCGDDPFVQELEEAVTEAKKNREWRHEYMTLLIRDQDNIEKGREEGRKEGREEGMELGREQEREQGIGLLISSLNDFGVSPGEILKKVQEKYNLTGEEVKKYFNTL